MVQDSKDSTSVLVIGGGLVGLSSALFLAWQGVPTILIEKHPGSSPHPRAIGYTHRTMELLRAVGIEDKIPRAPAHFRLRRTKVESLAGKWFEETSWTKEKTQQQQQQVPQQPPQPQIEYSPVGAAAVAQDRIEPILRDRAIELGADVRLSTKLLRFEQDVDGVTAWVQQRSDGKEYTVRAKYMIAADGHHSPVREELGIKRTGRGHIKTVRSVLFKANLDKYLESGVSQFEIKQDDGFEAFLTTYHDGRWVLIFSDDVERDPSTLGNLVHKAIGRADIDVEVVTTGRWEMAGLVAEKYMSGRVFLAGDAAHSLPPNRGGYGANTGIHDAHNIAWKLASVLSGKSTPDLLNTYDEERRPVAVVRHDQIFARPDYKGVSAGVADHVAILDDNAMEFGQIYRSSSVIGAGSDLPVAQKPEQWAGQPGTRAPHMWVMTNQGDDESKRVSTLDLFQRKWVVLSEDEKWRSVSEQASKELDLSVEFLRVGVDVIPSDIEAFRSAFGVGSTGVTLIRPDGYVGWRLNNSETTNPSAMIAALSQLAAATKTLE